MFDAALSALAHLGQWQVLLALFVGATIGVLNGAMPGGAVPSIVVLLGFAYGLDPFIALPLAIGMIVTVATGDTLPAVLLGMPGSTSGQATILDGYPLSRQGKSGVALSAAYFSSMIGGVFGAIFLFLVIPVARPVVNAFGSAEFFIMGLVAIAVVGVVSSGALLRGLMAGVFGLLLAAIGFDTITGTPRLTFGMDYLWSGIPLVPVVIGLFALPEFLDMIVSDSPIARSASGGLKSLSGRKEGMRQVLKNWPLVARSSAIGLFVGLLPGIGGSLAQWLSYASARQTTAGGTESFGTGDIRGVIAPESANNAVDGGQLVPTLFFGVPGSVGMAIFLGFMIILGLQPGPSMLNENLDLTLTIAFSLVLANIFATGMVLGFTPWLARIAFVPPNVLVPLVFSVLALAAFQSNFSIWDLWIMLLFGGIGYFMKSYGWPRPPIIISLVLGSIIEKYYSISFRTYGWDMFSRIPVILIITFAIGTVGYTIWLQRNVARNKAIQDRKLQATEEDGPPEPGLASSASTAPETATEPALTPAEAPFSARLRPTVNGAFMMVLAAFSGYFLFESLDWARSAALLPRTFSAFGLFLAVAYLAKHLARPGTIGGKMGRILDIGRSAPSGTAQVVMLRTAKGIGSAVAFVLGVWLVGFHITVPLYVFLYLLFFGNVSWWKAAIAAGLFVAALYYFFGGILHVNWPDPVLESILPGVLIGD